MAIHIFLDSQSELFLLIVNFWKREYWKHPFLHNSTNSGLISNNLFATQPQNLGEVGAGRKGGGLDPPEGQLLQRLLV